MDWIKLIIASMGTGIISAIVTLIVYFKIEKKKIRPQVTTHECRIYGKQVYTYFDENNKVSSPACPFLAKDGSSKCNYLIKNTDNDKEEKERILEINKKVCYLSL